MTAQWTPTNYTSSYNLNSGSVSPANPTSYNITTNTFTLTNPTRSGYNFTGWSGTGISGTSTSVTIAKGSTGNRSYTANWEVACVGICLISKMQEMTTAICNATAVGASKTLTDDRTYPSGTSKTYTVKKLQDGKCWMTQNLRISNTTITSANSNVSSNFTIPASSTSGFSNEDSNSAYVDATYGGYYTFYTATAGTGGSSKTSGDVSSSICPKGWRLPTGGSSGEFNTLYTKYNSFALMQGDPGFILSGQMHGGSVYGQGSNGFYWSSTVFSSEGAYGLGLFNSSVSPAYDYFRSKQYGYSVRCVAS